MPLIEVKATALGLARGTLSKQGELMELRKAVGCIGVSIGREVSPPGSARRGLGAIGLSRLSCSSGFSLRNTSADSFSSSRSDEMSLSSSCAIDASETLLLIRLQVLLTEPHQPLPVDDSEASFSRRTSTLVGCEVTSLIRVFFMMGDKGPGSAVMEPRSVELSDAAKESADLSCALRCNLLIRVTRSAL